MIATILACTLLQDRAAPETADEWLRAVRETYRRSRTIRVAGRVEYSRDGAHATPEQGGPFLFEAGSGNRVHARAVVAGQTYELRCDGARAVRRVEETSQTMAVDAGLGAHVREAAGLAYATYPPNWTAPAAGDTEIQWENAALEDPAEIADRGAAVVSYTLVSSGQRYRMRLWIDSERLVPLRREMSDPNGARWTWTEVFDSVEVDGEITDEEFRIPEDW